MVLFEWDKNKNDKNIAKHGIAFDEAESVFDDENGILIDDPDHSSTEERFILIGFSSKARMLIVCHCYRITTNFVEIVRIISARKPTKREEKIYSEENGL